VQDETLKLN